MAEMIQKKLIEDEMKNNYMDYAMSVIVSRALPDVRDGLKPVHRRVLFTMHQLGLQHNKPFKKSANVVGMCMAKWHPHGDVAIYDTLVRMAQDFSLRYLLVDGQGNFGCFTIDTKIALTDGRNLSFKELIEEHKNGKKNYTYTINNQGSVEIAEITNPRLTKKNQKIMKVILDNGEEIRCTLNHRFMLRNGQYREVKYLKPEDSLMPLYLRLSTEKDNVKPSLREYQMVYQPNTSNWVPSHNLADDWNLRNKIYNKSAGRIRHHLDFNKLNNNPNNIRRIKWGDHWDLHVIHASELHKDEVYRKKIAEGRNKYWSNKANRELSSKRLSERNRKNWQNLKYRENMIRTLSRVNTEFVKNHPETREERSKRLKKLWKNDDYKQKMSVLKSEEMKKRWKENDYFLRKFTSEESKKIWSNPSHRELVSKASKKMWQNPDYKKKMSEESKRRWKDEAYRSKFPPDHFKRIAKNLWKNPDIKRLHQEKALAQWQNPEFREKISKSVSERNKRRLKENPNCMKDLAAKAKISLRKKWQDDKYKEAVIKSKILGYVNSLLSKYGIITPEVYEAERRNNGIPKVENAVKYFGNFSEIIEHARRYNHKIVGIEFLEEESDVYDLTIEGTHNFSLASGIFVHNSIDGDSASAMRYSEARMTKLSENVLHDIEKETVDFISNYDGSDKEPVVLPSKVPNLLINGSSGIAVGMATNMAPHNIREVCDAIILFIDNPNIHVSELLKIIPGPDFPTGGYICGRKGIIDAYTSGRGRLVLRARTEVEDKGDRKRIVVSEIPYQVNKSMMIENIADLVRDKKIEGISDIRDESDRHGIRVVFDLKKGFDENVVLNQLYHTSQLQTTFGIINIALVDGQPKVLCLKDLITYYVNHRKDVVTRRTKFDLTKAEEKAHILEGLRIALQQIDPVIKTIKSSKDGNEAKARLIQGFKLTDKQAQAILDMKLQRLTSLEQEGINNDYQNTVILMQKLRDILSSENKIFGIIKSELEELKNTFSDDRKTDIIEQEEEIDIEDMIPEEDVAVTITHSGYIKKLPMQAYKQQKRGGKGVRTTELKEEDAVEHVFITSNHHYILFFTNKGKVHWLKAYNIPTASRYSKGKAIINLISIEKDERITAMIPISEFDEKHFLLMATKKGLVKKTKLIEYSNPRKGGIAAIKLREGDELVKVLLTPGVLNIVVATKKGIAVKFNEQDVSVIGRTGMGVKGIKLKGKDEVVGMEVALEAGALLTVTENGYGKRTEMGEYTLIKRGGSGVINIKTSERNGDVIGIKTVKEDDEILVVTKKGQVIRVPVKDISIIGRATQGVRIMALDEGDKITNITRVIAKSEE